MRDRFLNRYFPSIEHSDLKRYGTIAGLNELAQSAGFQSVDIKSVVLREEMPTDEFFAVIKKKVGLACGGYLQKSIEKGCGGSKLTLGGGLECGCPAGLIGEPWCG